MLSAENPDKNDRLRLAAQGDAESWAALVSGSRIEDELGSRLEIQRAVRLSPRIRSSREDDGDERNRSSEWAPQMTASTSEATRNPP